MTVGTGWAIAGILCTLGAMYLIMHDEWVGAAVLVTGGILSLIHMEQT